jgi:hypothetical protein
MKLAVAPADSSTHQHAIQEDNVLNLSFVIPEYHLLDVNDYVDFGGSRYRVIEQYVPGQKSTVEWDYSIKFYGVESLIKRGLVLKLVDNEMQPVFSLTAPASQHMTLLVDNINRIFGTTDFKVGEVIATENIHIDYNSTYISDGLSELSKQAGTEWWFDGMTVNLIRCEYGAEITLGYRNGLTRLERTTANNVKFFTRLYPLGSTRNIDYSTYGYNRLQLPDGQKYVEQNVSTYGIIEHSEEASFSHIYPRRVGVISAVRSEEKTGTDGNLFKIYYFKDADIPFNPNDYEISGLVKHITFESGELNGRDFEVNYDSDTEEFEIITQFPEYSEQLPNDILTPEEGNKYVLWNLRMPDEYYLMAEREYLEAVIAYMADNNLDKSVYKAPTDYIEIARRGLNLIIGQRIRLESEQFFPEQGYRSSRITRITCKINNPAQMDIEISDVLSVGKVTALENSVSEIKTIIESTRDGLPDIIKTWESTPPGDWNLYSALKTVRSFLNRQFDDIAQGLITFIKGIRIGKEFVPGFTGIGGFFDQHANGEVESLFIRRKLIVPEIVFNSVEVNLGDKWRAPGGGVIQTVNTETRTVDLDLQDGQIGAVAVGDICMGIFHSLEPAENATEYMDDSLGNRTYAGFMTVYFTVTEVIGDRNQQFKYQLRPESERWPHSFHPAGLMHFVAYGNFVDTDRQTSVYETRTYTRMLWKQNTWEIGAHNIAQQEGDLSNMNVHGIGMTGYSSYLNNIYMTGSINQIKPDGSTAPVPNFLPDWAAGDQVNFYDEVSYRGGRWLCVDEDGTDTVPGPGNQSWFQTVAPGNDGASVTSLGDWRTGLNVPNLGVVRMGRATWICINPNGTTNPPLWTVTDKDGNRIMQTQDGGQTWGYILTGEINTAEYTLVAEDGINGVDGKDGGQGIQGCIILKSEWGLNNEYRNDEALTSGTRYLDVALVRDDSLQTGWQAYKCLKTHISSVANAPGNAEFWEAFGLNVNAIFTSLIIAKDAQIDFMQGNQLLIKKPDGTVTAGVSGSQEGGKIRFWAGGTSPQDAPFSVDEQGNVIAKQGSFAGIVRLSTNYEGNISDDNIFYLPVQTTLKNMTMGHELEDIGKVVRLFNPGAYTDADYRIGCCTFGITGGFTDATLGTVYALLKPQEVLELTCYRLPPSKFNNAYQTVGKWYISGRYSQDDFKKTYAIGRFPRMLAIGRLTGTPSGAGISYTFYDGRTSGVFSVNRVKTSRYRVSWNSGVIPTGYTVMLTGYGPVYSGEAPTKGTVYTQSSNDFEIVVSDDATGNDGSCNFMIFAPDWEYDLQNI